VWRSGQLTPEEQQGREAQLEAGHQDAERSKARVLAERSGMSAGRREEDHQASK